MGRQRKVVREAAESNHNNYDEIGASCGLYD